MSNILQVTPLNLLGFVVHRVFRDEWQCQCWWQLGCWYFCCFFLLSNYHHIKRGEKKLGKEGQRGKFCSGGTQEKWGFWDPCLIPIFVRSGVVVNLVVVPIGLVVSLVSRFWGHWWDIWKQPFLGQRRRIMMTTTSTSLSNQTTKVKRPREGGFCVNFF